MKKYKKTLIENIIAFYKNPPYDVVIILWGIFIFSGVVFLSNTTAGFTINALGDAMGGIFGTLISSLTFVYVAYSFGLQKDAFRLQKDELEATRKEFASQSEVLKKDNFENTFFKLTEKQQNLIEYFQWGEKKGYDALYHNEEKFSKDINFFGNKSSPHLAEYIKNYVRINEVIINLIESTFDTFEDKFIYYDILSSLQSDIIRTMICGYYKFENNNYYLVILEKYSHLK